MLAAVVLAIQLLLRKDYFPIHEEVQITLRLARMIPVHPLRLNQRHSVPPRVANTAVLLAATAELLTNLSPHEAAE